MSSWPKQQTGVLHKWLSSFKSSVSFCMWALFRPEHLWSFKLPHSGIFLVLFCFLLFVLFSFVPLLVPNVFPLFWNPDVWFWVWGFVVVVLMWEYKSFRIKGFFLNAREQKEPLCSGPFLLPFWPSVCWIKTSPFCSHMHRVLSWPALRGLQLFSAYQTLFLHKQHRGQSCLTTAPHRANTTFPVLAACPLISS